MTLSRAVTHIWETGAIPQEMAWGILILLPKAVEGQFRGIGLLEIVWKLISRVLDIRIKAAIDFHDCLHGFRAKRGTGTAIIEAKLLQQLATIDQAPLYKIFLDLKKAYDTLDRERALEILEGYGVGPNARRLLRNFWDNQWVVPRQAGYFGTPFKPTRGLTQGDIISPTLFNVVCDAIVRYWLFITTAADGDNHSANAQSGMSYRVVLQNALFYADDGEISSRNPEWLQQAIDTLVEHFERVGLKTNVGKTEAMVCQPPHIAPALSEESYASFLGRTGESSSTRKRRRVTCERCNSSMQAKYFRIHNRRVHGLDEGQVCLPAPTRDHGQLYTMDFPRTLRKAKCPVPLCPGTASSWWSMRRHFVSRHPVDSVHIRQEGPRPFEKCPRCGMQLPPSNHNAQHYRSSNCIRDAERKQQREALNQIASANE